MLLCDTCRFNGLGIPSCCDGAEIQCSDYLPVDHDAPQKENTTSGSDAVNHPSHYAGQIEVIDYIRDKLTEEGFTEYCYGNVLKYISRWRKKDGVQDLKKARVYLDWMIESAGKEQEHAVRT